MLLAHNLPQNFPVGVTVVGASPPAVTDLFENFTIREKWAGAGARPSARPTPLPLLVLPVLLAALLMMPLRAKAAEYACDAVIPVSMELNGTHDEKFEVTIELAEKADPDTPMPAEEACSLLLGDGENGGFSIRYTEPGDYFYVIRQTAGSTAYMSYDTTVYEVQVQVTNDTAEDGTTTLKYQVVANDVETPTEKAAALADRESGGACVPEYLRPADTDAGRAPGHCRGHRKRHLGRHAHAETGLHPAADQRRFAADRAGGGAGAGCRGHRGAGGAARAEKQAGRPVIIRSQIENCPPAIRRNGWRAVFAVNPAAEARSGRRRCGAPKRRLLRC